MERAEIHILGTNQSNISINSGGFHKGKELSEFSHTFVDHLRDYESPSPMSRVSNSRQGGVSVKSGHYSQEYLSRLRTLQAYQKMRSFRLAEPKKRRPKFTNLFIHKPKQSVRTENSEKTRKNT